MRSAPPPSTFLARVYITSAFAIQVILCLKVQVEINLPCHVHTAFFLSGKLEIIFIDVIGISTLYLYFCRKNSSIPEIKQSIPYPWK